jgi:DNA topoisomerase-3
VLILCEKPSVAAGFAKTLGCVAGKGCYRNEKYVITYCVGHLYRLWDPGEYQENWKKWSLENLPILPEKYRYKKNDTTADQADVVNSLLKSNKDKDILIATDAGREGELIARIALAEAGISDISRCKRFWVSEALTPEVITRGIRNAKPLAEYNGIAAQGFARQRSDWIVGMNMSRYITLAWGNNEKFSVGRVQSAVLAAVARRNAAVANFKATPYNELEITIKDKAGTGIKCLLIHPETQKTAFALKSPYLYQALVYAKLNRDSLEITREEKKKAQKPEKLLNLTALQKEAFKKFGYSPDETLETAQALYEKHKCLSYPRTPSRVMGNNNAGLFKEKFELLSAQYRQWSQFSVPGLITGDNKHIFNSADLEDHHALIPLAVLPGGASGREKNVYEIVVKSFFVVCMPDHTWKECVYIVKNGGYVYKAVTKEIIEAGWKKAFTEEDEREETPALNRALDIKTCRIENIGVLDKKTSPPKDYQIDSLLAFMERPQAEDAGMKLAGLGTPATRAEIIKNLFERKYLIEDKKKLKATKKGVWLVKLLAGDLNLVKLTDAKETTAWETRLGENPEAFEKSIAEYVAACVQSKPRGAGEGYKRETLGTCPVCGEKINEGKKSYFCSAWNNPEKPCEFKIWKEIAGAKITPADAELLLERKKTGIKQCRSKAGKKFKACFGMSKEKKGEIEFIFNESAKKEKRKYK